MAITQREFCTVEKDGHLTIVTINRPDVMNSTHYEADLELDQVWDEFAEDPEQWVGIITGAGDRAFSTGNDLKTSLFDHLEHLEPGRSADDILYEVLLKLGLDLCVPIEPQTIAGKRVHSVGGGVLMACLAEDIKTTEAEALALGMAAWLWVVLSHGAVERLRESRDASAAPAEAF